MCKFKKPEIPANITADERRSLMFNALSSLDLNDKLERERTTNSVIYPGRTPGLNLKQHTQVLRTKLSRILTQTCLTSQIRM